MYKTITMTIEEILAHIERNPCSYYDYIDRTQSEWQNWLENSEVNHYTKISDDIYVNNCEHCYVIKKYKDGTVYSWTIGGVK